MTVLAIDPGNELSAFVVWDGASIRWFGKAPNAELRVNVIRKLRGDETIHLAIEVSQSYLMPRSAGRSPFFPQQVLDTALEAGRMIEAWGGPFTIVDRRAVKLHLIGRAAGGDPEVRAALLHQIGPKGTKADPGPCYGMKADLFAALGVACCYWDTMRGKE